MTELNSSKPQAKYLSDYKTSDFLIPTVNLSFNLDDNATLVKATYQMTRQNRMATQLVLDSQVKDVIEISIDDEVLEQEHWTIEHHKLIIDVDKDKFELTIVSMADPANNKALEGLYKSSGVYCTQCEAEGFRKISPFLDRPDVLSVYTVTIFADKKSYPFLLSNGNNIASGELEEDGELVHWITWHDPHPKPCYLFALVAGDFDLLTDQFKTRSGKNVKLEIFVDKGNLDQAGHAMASLKKSMAWDETTYGLEYDLDTYMIVAVDFFNMGAMENKGLNIFNSKYVLANQLTATDTDYHGVEAVIAHEYFHNWTGNRVTCRDWFQLSLKEGLTVFRDQQFSADMGSEVLERIKHASIMRTHQFAEDAGPMAHSIRPNKVIEMNNFYTVTVYDKGAEVIRMLHSLLTASGFRKGMDLYFKRHDGQAVTCDDFIAAMADANNTDLTLFKNWYSQAGTPKVKIDTAMEGSSLQIRISQSIPSRPTTETTLPLMIPIQYELLSKRTGASLKRGTWTLTQTQNDFNELVNEPVELVLFENFSAPVAIDYLQTNEQLLFIAKHAADPFCRWDAIQRVWANEVQSGRSSSDALNSFAVTVIQDETLDTAIKAELLNIPNFDSISQHYDVIDVEQIVAGLENISMSIAQFIETDLFTNLGSLQNIATEYEPSNVAQRRLKQILLGYLARLKTAKAVEFIEQAFKSAQNMTEKMNALDAARVSDIALLQRLLAKMDETYQGNTLVLDKMLSLIGRVDSEQVFELMAQWSQHPGFDEKNPNRIRALYGAFIMGNQKHYHDVSGSGYQFLVDLLLKIDQFNPQVASRMIVPLMSFARYDTKRSELMTKSLQKLSDNSISADLFEKVTAALS